MRYVDAGVVLLFPREPYVEWANRVSAQGHEFDPELAMPTAYLIPGFDTLDEVDAFLREHHGELFEAELGAWTEEEAEWPEDRSLEEFWEWFAVEYTEHVADLTR